MQIRTQYGAGSIRAVVRGQFSTAHTVKYDHRLRAAANHARAQMALVRVLRRDGARFVGVWVPEEITGSCYEWTFNPATGEGDFAENLRHDC